MRPKLCGKSLGRLRLRRSSMRLLLTLSTIGLSLRTRPGVFSFSCSSHSTASWQAGHQHFSCSIFQQAQQQQPSVLARSGVIASIHAPMPLSPDSEGDAVSNFEPHVDENERPDATQIAAIAADAPAILLVAGAGTGKTRVLAARLAHILRQQTELRRQPRVFDDETSDPVSATSVAPRTALSMTLVLSFTSSAAEEICGQAAALPGGAAALDQGSVWHGTFHSFATRLLSQYPYLGTGLSRFTIADASDQQAAMRAALRDLDSGSSKSAYGAGIFLRPRASSSASSRVIGSQQAGNFGTGLQLTSGATAHAVLRRISVWKEQGLDEAQAQGMLARRSRAQLSDAMGVGSGEGTVSKNHQDDDDSAGTVTDGRGGGGGGGELYSQDGSTVGRVPEGKNAGNQAGGKGVERGAGKKRPMRGRSRSSLQYDDTVERIAAAAYPLYQQHLRASGKLDFGDLLLCTVHLLSTQPAVLDRVHREIGHVLVDEFQDTSPVQYELMRLLVRGPYSEEAPRAKADRKKKKRDDSDIYAFESYPFNPAEAYENDQCEESEENLDDERHVVHLICAGDDDQSIYAWRGVNAIQNMRRFTTDFDGALVLHLANTYRMPPHVLGAATRLISTNHGRFAKPPPRLGQGGPASALTNLALDASAVADSISSSLAGFQVVNGDHQQQEMFGSMPPKVNSGAAAEGMSIFSHSPSVAMNNAAAELSATQGDAFDDDPGAKNSMLGSILDQASRTSASRSSIKVNPEVHVQGVFDSTEEAKYVASSIIELLDSPQFRLYRQHLEDRFENMMMQRQRRSAGDSSNFAPWQSPSSASSASSSSISSSSSRVVPLSIAVLVRSAWQFREFEEQFLLRRIHYKLEGGVSFFAKPDLRFPLTLLRCLVFPDSDELAFRTVASHSCVTGSGVGEATLGDLAKIAAEHAVSFEQAARLAVSEGLVRTPRVARNLETLLGKLERWRSLLRAQVDRQMRHRQLPFAESNGANGWTHGDGTEPANGGFNDDGSGEVLIRQIFHESGYYAFLEERRGSVPGGKRIGRGGADTRGLYGVRGGYGARGASSLASRPGRRGRGGTGDGGSRARSLGSVLAAVDPLENLDELSRAAGQFPDVETFLHHVALQTGGVAVGGGARSNSNKDEVGGGVDSFGEYAHNSAFQVKLMTMHRAKGREFSHVFIPGWEEGVFPLFPEVLLDGSPTAATATVSTTATSGNPRSEDSVSDVHLHSPGRRRRSSNDRPPSLGTRVGSQGRSFLSGSVAVHAGDYDTAGTVDEERRLAYVALTRAMQSAVLTYASRRRFQGTWYHSRRSRFVDELPAAHVTFSAHTIGAHSHLRSHGASRAVTRAADFWQRDDDDSMSLPATIELLRADPVSAQTLGKSISTSMETGGSTRPRILEQLDQGVASANEEVWTAKTAQSMTVAQLKNELRAVGLPVSGRKMELVERLLKGKSGSQLQRIGDTGGRSKSGKQSSNSAVGGGAGVDFENLMSAALERTKRDWGDLSRFTVRQLKQVLAMRNLPVSGTKAVLIQRLLDDLELSSLVSLSVAAVAPPAQPLAGMPVVTPPPARAGLTDNERSLLPRQPSPELMRQSVVQLKASLKARGLRRTGNKKELALRLQDALKEEADRELRVESMSVAELKTELKRRGLRLTGAKTELAARLQDALDDSDGSDFRLL